MKIGIPLLLFKLWFILIACSDNLAEKGKEAYHSGDYNQAIDLLTSIKQEEAIDPQLNEMIALAYMYRGKDLFDKTLNIKAYAGNYQLSKPYIPLEPSEEFKVEYTQLMVAMAEAYRKIIPKNNLEKEQFYAKTLEALHKAQELDSANVRMQDIFAQLREENFQTLFQKAQSMYNRAQRTKDWDLLFTAEILLNDAGELDPKNKEVLKLRRQIRQAALGVLNYRDGISMAITQRLYDKDKLVMYLAIENYLDKSITIDIAQIELVDVSGRVYGVDQKEMRVRELFGQPSLKNTVLNSENAYTAGVVAFDIPKNRGVSLLRLKQNNQEIAVKYFQ
jgi:hypothetical protein